MKQTPVKRAFKLSAGEQGAALTIRVTPRARKTEFGGILDDGTIRVRIAAPPVDGKANQALIAFLAKALSVRKNAIEIVAGERGLDKIVSVIGVPAHVAEERLKAHLQSFLSEE